MKYYLPLLAVLSLTISSCIHDQKDIQIEDVIRLNGADAVTTHYDDGSWSLDLGADSTIFNIARLNTRNSLYFPKDAEGGTLICWAIILNGSWRWLPPTADNTNPQCIEHFYPDAGNGDEPPMMTLDPEELDPECECSECSECSEPEPCPELKCPKAADIECECTPCEETINEGVEEEN